MGDITGIAVSASPKDTVQQYLQTAQQVAPELLVTANAIQKPEANAEEQSKNEDQALNDQEKQELNEAIQNLDSLIKPLSIGLNVQRIDEVNQLYVQLLDRETGEVLREIPSRKILEMQKNLRAMQGLLFDQKV